MIWKGPVPLGATIFCKEIPVYSCYHLSPLLLFHTLPNTHTETAGLKLKNVYG